MPLLMSPATTAPRSKVAFLQFSSGDFNQGFTVSLRLGEEGKAHQVQTIAQLPSLPELPTQYQAWHQAYRSSGLLTRLEAVDSTPTNLSLGDCKNLAQKLEDSFRQWLNALPFQEIQRTLLLHLSPTDPVRIVLELEDPRLQQLPWHCWSLLDALPQAEIAMSNSVAAAPAPPQRAKAKVQILAILGDRRGIDIDKDAEELRQLPGSAITFLTEPNRSVLAAQLQAGPWDIVYFAGHSFSLQGNTTGCICINPKESLSIEELCNSLRQAIDQGLQIAIFNSCEGLGPARQIAKLNIPQTIFMREPVPDLVAQAFLKHFLEAFSQGRSLYQSVRQARQNLQPLEDRFPCATWLPVIYQNPTVIPPSWENLGGRVASQVPLLWKVAAAVGCGAIAVGLTLGLRSVGGLQPAEFKVYDALLGVKQVLQPERSDSRIVIVEIDDQSYKEERDTAGYSISHKSLETLLKKLDALEPAVIGLDLYRDMPKNQVPKSMLKQLEQMKTWVVGGCKRANTLNDLEEVRHPEGLKYEDDQIGYVDFQPDADQVTRRQILQLYAPADMAKMCKADRSLGLLLALKYLGQTLPEQTVRQKGLLQVDEQQRSMAIVGHRFGFLDQAPGFYNAQQASGEQILVNYRAQNFATLPLRHGEINPQAIKGKIVIVGVTHRDSKDSVRAQFPFAATQNGAQSVPGVLLQAQLTSQLVSAVVEGRSLLRFAPRWGEIGWIAGWTFVGAGLGLGLHGLIQRRSLGMVATLAPSPVLIGISAAGGLCLTGAVLPVVPAAVGAVVAQWGTYQLLGWLERHASSLKPLRLPRLPMPAKTA
jgi:CHASE2 domain-containing sensor protein